MNLLERVFLGKKIQRGLELDRKLAHSEGEIKNSIQSMESGARVIRTLTESMAMVGSTRGKDKN